MTGAVRYTGAMPQLVPVGLFQSFCALFADRGEVFGRPVVPSCGQLFCRNITKLFATFQTFPDVDPAGGWTADFTKKGRKER